MVRNLVCSFMRVVIFYLMFLLLVWFGFLIYDSIQPRELDCYALPNGVQLICTPTPYNP